MVRELLPGEQASLKYLVNRFDIDIAQYQDMPETLRNTHIVSDVYRRLLDLEMTKYKGEEMNSLHNEN